MNCSEKQQNPITVRFILKMNKFLITTEKSYPISKVRSGCAFLEQCEEIPHIQGKKNSTKTVGAERRHQGQMDWNHNHRQLPNLITWTTALSNSMKIAMMYGATQERRVMVEKSGRVWSTGEGNGKPLQYSCLENPMNRGKWQSSNTVLGR